LVEWMNSSTFWRIRKSMICPLPDCACHDGAQPGRLVTHGFYTTRAGKRRRYRCCVSGKTFCSTKNTPYYRLQHRRATFDEVAALSVEGVNKSAISRVKGIAWNTVHRWLERAAVACRRFNQKRIETIEIVELQADEIRTFVGEKKVCVWIFATLEVCSRYWPSTVVGNRSKDNAMELFQGIPRGTLVQEKALVVTDAFAPYERAIRQTFGSGHLYGQVLKTRQNDRIIKVERRQVIGSPMEFEKALEESEDSSSLNTSFIERLNLTIRQACSYLTRRTTCHARSQDHLIGQLEMVRCHYNFLRPHKALRFGRLTKTPAMQAGLASGRLSFRDVFLGRLICVIWIRFTSTAETESAPLAMAA
jgi:IS1 family transposase/transposase-like protein